MNTAKTALETIRAKKAQHEKYSARKAELIAERDEKTGVKYATTTALLSLAEAGEPRSRGELRDAVMAGVDAESACINPVFSAQTAIDDAIIAQVRASVPEDLRAGVNHKLSRSWIAEQEARYMPRQGSAWLTPNSSVAEIYAAADLVAQSLERSMAEMNRASSVARKLGVSVGS